MRRARATPPQGGESPAENVSSLSPSQYRTRLASDFAWSNATLGARVAQMYSAAIDRSPQLAFDELAADVEMTCGQKAIALAAAALPRATTEGAAVAALRVRAIARPPVYLVHNAMFDPKRPSAGAHHEFDIIAATTRTDTAAAALRDRWHEFARTGRVASWETVDAARPWSTVRLDFGPEPSFGASALHPSPIALRLSGSPSASPTLSLSCSDTLSAETLAPDLHACRCGFGTKAQRAAWPGGRRRNAHSGAAPEWAAANFGGLIDFTYLLSVRRYDTAYR